MFRTTSNENVAMWLLLLSFSGRTGAVKLRSLKICAAALCSATLERKYRCMLLILILINFACIVVRF